MYRDESETLLDVGHSQNFATAFMRNGAQNLRKLPALGANFCESCAKSKRKCARHPEVRWLREICKL